MTIMFICFLKGDILAFRHFSSLKLEEEGEMKNRTRNIFSSFLIYIFLRHCILKHKGIIKDNINVYNTYYIYI